jgi:hypothetical protein
MKIQAKVSPTLIVELEGDKQKDLFKQFASATEVFNVGPCGLCGCKDVLPKWRVVTIIKGKKSETYEFPEYHCRGLLEDGRRCGARLTMSTQNDDSGNIYPNRKLVNGERPATKAEIDAGTYGDYGSHNGWYRFVKKSEGDE